MSLGGLLVGRGLVTLDDIDAALERQRAEGGRLGDNLIALGLLTAEELMSVINSTPPIPTAISETGISQRSLLNLLLKFMHLEALETVSELADRMKLPRGVVQQLLDDAQPQRLLQALGSVRGGIAASIRYSLSEQGRASAKDALEQNLYLGPAPVSLVAYQEQIQRQRISNEMLNADTLRKSFAGLVVPEHYLRKLLPGDKRRAYRSAVRAAGQRQDHTRHPHRDIVQGRRLRPLRGRGRRSNHQDIRRGFAQAIGV